MTLDNSIQPGNNKIETENDPNDSYRDPVATNPDLFAGIIDSEKEKREE